MQPPLPMLCLASESPRRSAILETLGLKFRVLSPNADEAHPDVASSETVVKENSLKKARSVLGQLKTNEIALGADTLVVLEKEVLGKPTDRDDAEKKLMALSGRMHRVVTGIALVSPQLGEASAVASSAVLFKNLTETEIRQYLSTKEPYDKAGAYGIQGLASLFIERIEGSYTNIMGLPVETLLRELARFTKTSVYQWFQ